MGSSCRVQPRIEPMWRARGSAAAPRDSWQADFSAPASGGSHIRPWQSTPQTGVRSSRTATTSKEALRTDDVRVFGFGAKLIKNRLRQAKERVNVSLTV